MKKSRRRKLQLVFWVIAAALTAWLIYAPQPKRPPPGTAHAVVEQMLEESTETPSGEEKAQPEVMPLPVPPSTVHVAHPPEIAIVIDDVGLDMKDSKRATELPPFVTLSYMPYASRLAEQTQEARDEGHELMLHMPMEPVGHDNPGPGALLTSLSPDEIRRRLDAALSSFTGFDGMNNHMGSKFTSSPAGMEIVVDELQKRHLFFLDSRTSAKSVGAEVAKRQGLPTIIRDIFLDDVIAEGDIRTQLDQAERLARRKGYAVAIGHPHAITLDVLEQWIPEAEQRGVTFVAVHDLLKPNP